MLRSQEIEKVELKEVRRVRNISLNLIDIVNLAQRTQLRHLYSVVTSLGHLLSLKLAQQLLFLLSYQKISKQLPPLWSDKNSLMIIFSLFFL